MKGVITIAGYGTRFLPASKAVPKEMFPIAGIPLIQHHVEGLVAAGITEIIVVVRGGTEVVQRHFAANADLERHLAQAGKLELLEQVRRTSSLADIAFVRQPETLPYGNAAPVLAARPWLSPGEPFYYMFGDDIVAADVPVPQQMVSAFLGARHAPPSALLAAQQIPADQTHLYGCLDLVPGSQNEVAGVVEKPAPGTAPSNWVLVGHYLFMPELFEVLTGSEVGKGGELWLADAVDRLAARSQVFMQPIEGQWLAAGDPLRYLQANLVMSLRRSDMREPLLAYLRTLVETARVPADRPNVECYSGHTYAQEPRAFVWQGQRLAVARIEHRWRTPQGPAFCVETEGGKRFDLQYDEARVAWAIRRIQDKEVQE